MICKLYCVSTTPNQVFFYYHLSPLNPPLPLPIPPFPLVNTILLSVWRNGDRKYAFIASVINPSVLVSICPPHSLGFTQGNGQGWPSEP